MSSEPMDLEHSLSSYEHDFMPVYRRFPALFVRGAGCRIWDSTGREYLDLLGGVAVNQLGHCHPAVVKAITDQASTLMHCSNLLHSEPPVKLVKKLKEISGMERVFFGVCGATANEAGLKIAKRHGLEKCPNGDYEIVALTRSFHGRTLGVLSATGQPKYQDPFKPLLPGFRHIDANDLAALREVVNEKTAAILVEPIQGEGGVNPLTTEFLQTARELADRYNAFLMLDEVQAGIGRTGKWFCYQHHGINPDIVLVAKGLGNGFPIGACLARGKAAEMLKAGDHGATFGGSPLATAVGVAVLETMERERILDHVNEVGPYFAERLRSLGGPVKLVRGKGLMIGVILDRPIGPDIVKYCFEHGVITNATDEFSLRMIPPLVLTKSEIDEGIEVIGQAMAALAPVAASR